MKSEKTTLEILKEIARQHIVTIQFANTETIDGNQPVFHVSVSNRPIIIAEREEPFELAIRLCEDDLNVFYGFNEGEDKTQHIV